MLEAERDEFQQQNSELFVLQQVFSTMNSTLEIDDILATVLRGVHEALRFGRVVLFEVREGMASRRLETELDGTVVPSSDPDAMRHSGSFDAMATGTSEFSFGVEDDGESPLVDVQGTYCMLPLISRNTVRGILYVDRPPGSEITEAQLRMLLDFAAQAAIAMENARLYSETKRLLEETQRLASTDPLTGLANRRALTELMERELHNAERYGAPLEPRLDRLVDEVRAARRRRSEEAARRVPVKLLFPLVGCILPAFGLLTVAPLIAGALRTLRLL